MTNISTLRQIISDTRAFTEASDKILKEVAMTPSYQRPDDELTEEDMALRMEHLDRLHAATLRAEWVRELKRLGIASYKDTPGGIMFEFPLSFDDTSFFLNEIEFQERSIIINDLKSLLQRSINDLRWEREK